MIAPHLVLAMRLLLRPLCLTLSVAAMLLGCLASPTPVPTPTPEPLRGISFYPCHQYRIQQTYNQANQSRQEIIEEVLGREVTTDQAAEFVQSCSVVLR